MGKEIQVCQDKHVYANTTTCGDGKIKLYRKESYLLLIEFKILSCIYSTLFQAPDVTCSRCGNTSQNREAFSQRLTQTTYSANPTLEISLYFWSVERLAS